MKVYQKNKEREKDTKGNNAVMSRIYIRVGTPYTDEWRF